MIARAARTTTARTGHWFTPVKGAAPSWQLAAAQSLSTATADNNVPHNFYARRSVKADAPAAEAPAPSRFATTCEVIVSKIFPAGFGWQAASVAAGNHELTAQPDSLGFALSTGAGDFAGVFLGHTAFSMAKNALQGKATSSQDVVTGLWLASAAFCSGTAWQPTVNFLHDAAGCSFAGTAVGTGMVTGLMFFAGLRVGRVAYKPLGLEGQTYSNLCGDALLSVSIGAATGTFVGTDVSFGAENALRPMFGVEDSMGDLEGMVRAGSSTAMGFLCMQSVQNAALPTGANWIDPVKLDEAQEAKLARAEDMLLQKMIKIDEKVDALQKEFRGHRLAPAA